VLLGASIYFYAYWSRWLALILCISTLMDYWIARGMEATTSARWKKLLLLTSLCANLGLLCYFKYANFFLDSLRQAAESLGFEASLPVLAVLLPVGISFYTFEAINYTVDVYRGHMRASRDLTHFMLFILFFPHLVAGPIVRAKAFLPLIARRKHWSWLRAHTGVLLILLGVIKKMAIADRIPAYVDPVFADPLSHGTWTLWLVTVAYTLQVYCDFSGYSDIALGLAHLFGYHLAINFNFPFLAANFSDLWGRWHMSLSTWIRDYVFTPLGGRRGGLWMTIRNLLIAFTLCGLWHGAAWHFVVWGFLIGFILTVHTLFRSWCKQHRRFEALLRTRAGTAVRVALTFITFCLTGPIFRGPDLGNSLAMLGRMFVPTAGAGLPFAAHGLYLTFAAVALGHALGNVKWGERLWHGLPAPVRGLAFGAVLTLAIVLPPGVSKAFIYFQF
jgi:alginate O-acetyltransferase complex protein AlgI